MRKSRFSYFYYSFKIRSFSFCTERHPFCLTTLCDVIALKNNQVCATLLRLKDLNENIVELANSVRPDPSG